MFFGKMKESQRCELESCSNVFVRKNKTQRFCSRSCARKTQTHLNSKTTFEWWVEKFGLEEANSRLLKLKEHQSNTRRGEANGMYRKEHNPLSKAQMSFKRRGKSYEDILGFERSQQRKKDLSERMKGTKNPMFGRVSQPSVQTRFGISGHYKGIFFRSLYEYSFLKHLECNQVDLRQDVCYETFRIPFKHENQDRTYHTDFFVKSRKIVYEVKPQGLLQGSLNQAKFEAAIIFLRKSGFQFKVVTENDFLLLSKQDAQNDKFVVFSKESENKIMSGMKLHDSVLARICQIVQESMLLGVDCVDILRQIELEEGTEHGTLELTEKYKQMVKAQHESMLKFVEEKKAEKKGV